jgi:hypothetical protein
MVNWIKIGGVERPAVFGYEVAYSYEMATGGNYNQLLFSIAGQVEESRAGADAGDMLRAASALQVKPITDLVFFGLKYGYRKEGMTIDFEVDDVAEWIFTDMSVLQQCITAIFESLPKPKSEDDEQPAAAKKKTPARPGSTGKALSKPQRR